MAGKNGKAANGDGDSHILVEHNGESVRTTVPDLQSLRNRQRFPFPTKDQAFADGHTLAPADELEDLLQSVIDGCEDFEFLGDRRVRILWKKGDKLVWIGKAKKQSEIEVLLSDGIECVILIALERCIMAGLTYFQVEALIDHELRHFGEDEHGLLQVVKHDLEEFNGTVARYGAWRPNINVFNEQLALFSVENKPSPAPEPEREPAAVS